MMEFSLETWRIIYYQFRASHLSLPSAFKRVFFLTTALHKEPSSSERKRASPAGSFQNVSLLSGLPPSTQKGPSSMRSEGETLTQVAPIHLGAHNHLTSEEEALKKKLESFSLSVLTQPRQETRFFPSLSARVIFFAQFLSAQDFLRKYLEALSSSLGILFFLCPNIGPEKTNLMFEREESFFLAECSLLSGWEKGTPKKSERRAPPKSFVLGSCKTLKREKRAFSSSSSVHWRVK